jgi:hypothetical protein
VAINGSILPAGLKVNRPFTYSLAVAKVRSYRVQESNPVRNTASIKNRLKYSIRRVYGLRLSSILLLMSRLAVLTKTMARLAQPLISVA